MIPIHFSEYWWESGTYYNQLIINVAAKPNHYLKVQIKHIYETKKKKKEVRGCLWIWCDLKCHKKEGHSHLTSGE